MDISLGSRIKQVRNKESQDSFAVTIGISRGSLSAYERGENQPPADTLQEICTKYKIEATWLLFGRGPMRSIDTEVGDLPACASQSAPIMADKKPHNISQAILLDPGEKCDVDLIMIPMVQARLSAGSGSLETGGKAVKNFAFRSDFLHRKGNPDNMVLMRVGGDSMQPEIMNNDVVLLDQGKRDLRPGPIFAVGFEEAIYLKRIDMLPGKIILKSVNPAYPPVELDVKGQNSDSFRIIGQVIWCGREY